MSEDNEHHGEKVIEEIRSLPIPPGWLRTSVGEVGDVRLGRQRSPKNRSADFPTKYIRAANITWAGLNLDDVLDMEFRPTERANYGLHPGDVLLSEASGSAGEVGKPAIWKGEIETCCFQNTVIRFRPKSVCSKFAYFVFLHFARSSIFAQVSKGVGIHHLSADRFASMPFFVPPVGEQDRIVAKIEELFSDLDAGVAALERAKANLKRYSAAVLKAAVEGKLTEEWRTKNPNTEPASKLLERILIERRKKWEADQLAKFSATGKEPPKNWREKYVEPTPPDTTGLSTLPEGWCWVSVGQLAWDSLIGLDYGRRFQTTDGVGCPYIKMQNVTMDGRVVADDLVFVPATDQERLRFSLSSGDLLFNTRNSVELVGKVGIVATLPFDAVYNNNLMRLRVGINPEYLCYWMCSSEFRRMMEIVKKATTNVAAVYAKDLFVLPVAVPSQPEQSVIVVDVTERFSQIEAAKVAIEHSLLRATRLRQSILKQAFEGKLVPQDPNDEPARVLLTRLDRQQRLTNAPSDGHCVGGKRVRIEGKN